MKKETKKAKPATKRRRPGHEDLLTDVSHVKPAEAPPIAKGQLGDRIKAAREMRELTVADISSRTGIDVATLKQIEANKIAPPLGQLIRLGKALDMKMGYFISPGVDKPITVVRKDQRQAVARHGQKKSQQYGYSYESLAPEKANRLMEPFIVTLMPTEAEEFSNHDGQEFIFVLEGEIKVQVGNQVEFLQPGDAVYYDSNQPHLVKAKGSSKARILAVLYAGAK